MGRAYFRLAPPLLFGVLAFAGVLFGLGPARAPQPPLLDLLPERVALFIEVDEPATLFGRNAAWPGWRSSSAMLEELRAYADSLLTTLQRVDKLRTSRESLADLFASATRVSVAVHPQHEEFLWNLMSMGVVKDIDGVVRGPDGGGLRVPDAEEDESMRDRRRRSLLANDVLFCLEFPADARPEEFLATQLADVSRRLEHAGVGVLLCRPYRYYMGKRFYAFRLGSRLFISTSPDLVKDVIDQWRLENRRVRALSRAPGVGAAWDRVRDKGDMRGVVNLGAAFRIIDRKERWADQQGREKEHRTSTRAHHQRMDAVVDYGSLGAFSFSSDSNGESAGTRASLTFKPENRFAKTLRGGPLNPTVLKRVPAGAQYALLARFGNPGAAWDRVKALLADKQKDFGDRFFDDWRERFKSEYRVVIDDVVPRLAGDVLLTGAPSTSASAGHEDSPAMAGVDEFLGHPSAHALMVTFKRREDAAQTFDRILEQLDPDGFALKESGRLRWTTPSFGKGEGLAFALLGDAVLATSSVVFLDDFLAVARGDEGAGALADLPAVKKALRMAGDEVATKFLYLNMPLKLRMRGVSQRLDRVVPDNFSLALAVEERDGEFLLSSNLPVGAWFSAMVPWRNAEVDRDNKQLCEGRLMTIGKKVAAYATRFYQAYLRQGARRVALAPRTTGALLDAVSLAAANFRCPNAPTSGGESDFNGALGGYVYVPPTRPQAVGDFIDDVLMFEDQPYHGGRRHVLMTDLTIRQLDEGEFKTLLARYQVLARLERARRESGALQRADTVVKQLQASARRYRSHVQATREKFRTVLDDRATPDQLAAVREEQADLEAERADVLRLARHARGVVAEIPLDVRSYRGNAGRMKILLANLQQGSSVSRVVVTLPAQTPGGGDKAPKDSPPGNNAKK